MSVIPFPLAARRGFVNRHADIIAGMRPKSAERHLEYQLEIQRQALERRGVCAEVIAREISSLRHSIVSTSRVFAA
jgi:hypothetical protein